MRLYVHPLSSNSRRATLVARHLGLDIALVSVALESGAQKSAEYMRLNPNGRVPLLIDGEFLLWESHAIMQYLADRAGADDVYPRDIQARGDVNRWLFWSACHFAPACALFIRERVSKKVLRLGEADPAEIARGEAQLPPAAAMLDEHLAGGQWIAQGRLTLADFAVAAPLMHSERAQLPLADYANLQDWFARVRATGAWQATEVA